MSNVNQPILKRDAQANVIQESYIGDMKFRGEYVANQLIYKGFARPGTATSEAKWQIAKITYDGTDITEVNWAQGSSEFNYVYDDRATYTYS